MLCVRRTDGQRHTKPNPNAGIAGGVVEKESTINISNISIFNPSTKKADKVQIKSLEDGSKVRVFKSSGKEI
jgi:large subunit ribosomal protein L24